MSERHLGPPTPAQAMWWWDLPEGTWAVHNEDGSVRMTDEGLRKDRHIMSYVTRHKAYLDENSLGLRLSTIADWGAVYGEYGPAIRDYFGARTVGANVRRPDPVSYTHLTLPTNREV